MLTTVSDVHIFPTCGAAYFTGRDRMPGWAFIVVRFQVSEVSGWACSYVPSQVGSLTRYLRVDGSIE